ncbi:sulfatase-like hydrolase/transferase [Paenibacillus cremeus]|uniref:Sulfatase-like hydrolase/transferase n=1 Tax=Paenibacillus cremeus TaxID=2163881 RepID=A0A559K3Y3_9BACL|nr:sulfatase-like hydrolase/transferase [Paenibacillus cremeus]TVY06842.1 sulfatase-like hydrolase/transferase [Paenibacillus cremeus]
MVSTNKRPHIIIFNPDQWRSDVMGHMGNAAAVTPYLDQLTQTEAVSFRSAFCQNTVCTPSRCSFMSGWYPHVRGHRTMYHMMQPDEPVLLKTLKDAGYFVWWGGKNDLVPAENGYEAYCDVKYKPAKPPRRETNLHAHDVWRGEPEGDNYFSFYAGKLEKAEDEEAYYDGDWANVLGAIDMIRNAPADQPLCIYLPLLYPHPPYGVEEPYFSMTDRAKLPPRIPAPEQWDDKPSLLKGIYEKQHLQGWTEDRWDELRATYYGMCSRVDRQFEMVMDALREAGMYDDSAVFFFSDHGDFTGDYGLVEKTQNTFEDCLSRVPFIIKPPKDVPVAPRVSEALVELIDFPATVEALLGLTPEHTHFGRSLLPVIAGETDEHRDAVFCEGGRLHGEEQCMERESTSVTSGAGLYWPRIQWQLQEGPEHSKAVMCRTKEYKYVRRMYEKDELYDLVRDPGETINRIADPEYAGVLMELKERLLTFYQETCDTVPHRPNKRM